MENPRLPGQAPPPIATVKPATNPLAVVSLAAGIAGYVLPHPFVGPLIAVITGHAARAQVRRTGERGGGMALVGLLLGYTHLLVTVILLVFFFGAVVAFVAFLAHSASHGQ